MNDVIDILDIMNSDFKLWERAESEELGGGRVRKTLTLPWGIGETEVVLEGMTDAGKRRQAVGAYGDYIRSVIRERTDDEAVTARAKAAAAKREQTDSTDSDKLSADQGLRNEGLQAAANEEPSAEDPSYAEGPASLGATLTARRTALRERIGRVETDLARWRRELKGIDAALEAMEEDDKEED